MTTKATAIRLDQWNAQKERLEGDLARQVPEMNLDQQLQAADRRAVALALPADSALIEFVRFHVYDFKSVPARGEPTWQPNPSAGRPCSRTCSSSTSL